MIKIEEDRIFLLRQRENGRPGHLAGVDNKLTQREERTRIRILAEEQRRLKSVLESSSLDCNAVSTDNSFESQSENANYNLSPDVFNVSGASDNKNKRGTTDFITPKLVAALDRCQLSIRDSVYIIQATVEALGHNIDEFPINKSTIHRIRAKKREERAADILRDFQNKAPDVVTVHWDGKLLPSINICSSKEERLPIVVTYGENEQLIAVPKLEDSTGKEAANAVFSAIIDWNLEDKVQILCCDTTASNMGINKGVCVRLEQKLERKLLFFACRHHVYELVLKSAFEIKINQQAVSPDITFFKKFKDNWNRIDATKVQNFQIKIQKHFSQPQINSLLNFYIAQLKETHARNDYRELIELAVIFLGGNADNKLKIKPPGAMHQARWMARAIYSIKMCLLESQIEVTKKEKQALFSLSLFITTTYVKPWILCSSAIKAPFQDLSFMKSLKEYESIDKAIAKATLEKFQQHLWYLTPEIAVFSLFDDEVDIDTKTKMITNLEKEDSPYSTKRYVIRNEEESNSCLDKGIHDFITKNSKDTFTMLKIGESFLQNPPTSWNNDEEYLKAKKVVSHLKPVNDVAERAVKLTQDFHGLITAKEEQKQFLLRCVQDHRKMYPDCKKETLKRKFPF